MNLKMYCNRETLIEAVNIALKAVLAKSTMDILNCLLISAEDGGFRILSNDLEMGIETSLVEANVISAGVIAIDAKIFSDFLRSLTDDEVLIECKENKLVYITSGKAEFKIMSRNEKEFPRLPDFDEDFVIKVSSSIFKDMVRKTIFSVSTDESRPVFLGELFRISEGTLSIVSADSYRMSQIKCATDLKDIDDFIVPAKTLNELIRIIPDEEEDITITMSDTQVIFEMSNCKMYSRLITGDFIDYEKIFPKEFNTEIKVNKEILLRCLERAFILSKENKKKPIKVVIKDNIMTITSNAEFSDFYEEINVEMSGEEILIGFNPKYLIEVLRVIDEDFVEMGFLSTLSPCIITALENKDAKYLVLPLKLKD